MSFIKDSFVLPYRNDIKDRINEYKQTIRIEYRRL